MHLLSLVCFIFDKDLSQSPSIINLVNMSADKQYISYNHVHLLCLEASKKVKEFNPDYIICIGGGGFIPARMMRTCIKETGKQTTRIFAIILSLYEDINNGDGTSAEDIGTKVNRIQWIDYEQCNLELLGKKVLIIDEVDDSRTTLHYALEELKKDCQEEARKKNINLEEHPELKTDFGIFVLHNKIKEKKADLPAEILNNPIKYIAARTIPDAWIVYPWENNDVHFHQEQAELQGNDLYDHTKENSTTF